MNGVYKHLLGNVNIYSASLATKNVEDSSVVAKVHN